MNTGCRLVVPARRIDEHDRANLLEPLRQRKAPDMIGNAQTI
jgi:hypothetical protein